MTLSREQRVGGAIILADLDWAKSGQSRDQVLGAAAVEAMEGGHGTTPADLLLAIKALARVQDAVGRYLHPNGGNKDQFIDEVLAAADDKEVVRAMTELREQAAFLNSFDAQVKSLDESDRS